LGREVLVLEDLQEGEPGHQQAEGDEHEQRRRQQAKAEARDLALGVAELGHGRSPGRPKTGRAPSGGSERSERGGTVTTDDFRPGRGRAAAVQAAAKWPQATKVPETRGRGSAPSRGTCRRR